MKNILAISGSTRAGSVNAQLLNWLADRHRETITINVYQDIANLPHFNPDHTGDAAPEVVKAFYTLVEHADAIIICTPEYVFSLPGAMKNALEWLVSTTFLADKPTAMIVASSLGEKAYESLDLILKTLGAAIGNDGGVLISAARTKIDDSGKIIDEETISKMDLMMQGLIATMQSGK